MQHPRRTILALFAINLTLALASWAHAAQTTKPASPTCAILLDPALSTCPAAALFEEQITHSPDAAFVERTDIAKVLKEQQLQAMFSPAAGTSRALLGQLVKADLLVLLRPAAANAGQPKSPAALDVVICETHLGLRLSVNHVALSKDIDHDAAALADIFHAAIVRSREPITTIAAVPPFLSRDLGFQFEPHQAAYQKLVEQTLSRHAGVLVVELAEACAISDELALAGGDVSRPSPLYFLGEFRNEAAPVKRTVSLLLTLKRGNKQIASIARSDLPLADAASFVQSTADDFFAKATGAKAIVPPDPAAESKELNDRAHRFLELGNYHEALALSEASLLLDPNQWQTHYAAAESILRIVGFQGVPADQRDQMTRLWRTGMEHAAIFACNVKLIYDRNSHLPQSYAWAPKDLGITLEERRDYVMRIFRAKAAAKLLDATPWAFVDEEVWLSGGDKLADAIGRKLRVVRECSDLFGDDSNELIRFFCSYPGPFHDDTPALRAALAQMKQMPAPVAREAADTMLARLDKDCFPFDGHPRNHADAAVHPEIVQAPDNSPSFHAEQINWNLKDAKGRPTSGPGLITGVLPATPGTDIIWTATGLYILKQHADLKPIAPIGHCAACFDGRFVWASAPPPASAPTTNPVLANGPDQCILCYDLQTETLHTFSRPQGIPPMPLDWFAAAPLAPGHIIAAGDFGRTWIMDIQFSPATGVITSKVIFEARDNLPIDDQNAWRNPHLAFKPLYATTLTEPAKAPTSQPTTAPTAAPHQRILIGRSRTYNPLLLDVETGQVTVVSDAIFVPSTMPPRTDHPAVAPIATSNGSIYWTAHAEAEKSGQLLRRFGFPEFKAVPPNPSPTVPPGQVVFTPNRVYILGDLGRGLFVAATPSAPFIKLRGDLPKLLQPLLYPSNVHGLIITSMSGNDPWSIAIK